MQLRLFRHFVPVSVVLLVSSDALLITGAFYQMLSQSGGTTPLVFGITSLPAQLAAGLSAAAVATMVSVGLYGEQAFVDFRLLLSKIAVAFVLVLMLVLVSATYWGDRLQHLPDTANLPLKATLIWLGCISVTRGAFLITLGRGLLKRRIAVLGNGAQAARIANLVKSGANQHFVPVTFIRMPGERGVASGNPVEWPEAGPDALAELGCELGASEIVVATDDRRGLPVRQLLHCKLAGIRVTEFLDFWERETRTVDLEALRPSWLFYSDGFRCGVFDEFLKRAFDIVVSLALLVFSAPLLLVTACLIKLDSPGPILYRQERVGYRGQVFTILKFRSMRADAERDGGPQWAAKADPRVTRVGAIIRKLRIDELAQVLNVLRGDMSFVGPRPERPYFVANLAAVVPYYNERHWVRPGITGWAQINYPYGASIEDARCKLSFDLYYVKNRSIFLDFVILLQTVRVIFWNYGAR
ncbi:MAG TPA: TIGR03013 family XrtA/PEP-CTERM system glycosyltransferase [Stellaceae bacterium]|nr:TIGR03013 family XrtA/PEP-CTERM system glycosyltransferase [Stellaceae bacterium]